MFLARQLFFFAAALMPLVSAESGTSDAANCTVRIPPLSTFRSLREVCIQTGSTAVLDFGTWDAVDSTLDFSVTSSRLAVRRSRAFTYDGVRSEAFEKWCRGNVGFTAALKGPVVHVSFQGNHQLAERHRVLLASPLFSRVTLSLNEQGLIGWSSLASEILKAGKTVSKDSPYHFIYLSGARNAPDSWLASACVPKIPDSIALAWEDTFLQVLGRTAVPSSPSIGVALSTSSAFYGGVIGYNAERAQIPDAEVVIGLNTSSIEFRKRYNYLSEEASRIDCALELSRRLLVTPDILGEVAKAKAVEGLLKTVSADRTSELVLQLLLETMNTQLAKHICDVVAEQDIAIRKRFVFSLLPSSIAVKEDEWKVHFAMMWDRVGKDPDQDIRSYAAGEMTR